MTSSNTDKYPENPILIIDDERPTLSSVQNTLEFDGIQNVLACLDSREAESMVAAQDLDLVLLDLTMPHISGYDLLKTFSERFPGLPVIVITGVDELDTAVECMKYGARDFLVKPVDASRLLSSVRQALEYVELQRAHERLLTSVLSGELQSPEAFAPIITRNEDMLHLFHYVESIARSTAPVLLSGDTGVGKELFARVVHKVSGVPGPLVPVNLAGLDDGACAEVLFGRAGEGGRKGMMELAIGGTLFLDEIGEIPAETQTRLMRMLQTREYFPVGSEVPRKAEVRIIASTNRDIRSLVEGGGYRQDLFFRLTRHHVRIPPLVDRLDDLPLLVDCFLGRAAAELGVKKPTPPKELVPLLSSHHFPGNVRERESMCFDAVSQHDSYLMSMDAFKAVMDAHGLDRQLGSADYDDSIRYPSRLPTLKSSEQQLLSEALDRADGNQTAAARILGISRQALNRRLKSTRSENVG